MKITLDIKKEKIKAFLEMLMRFDFLTDKGIQSIEGMEVPELPNLSEDWEQLEYREKRKKKVIDTIQKYFKQANLPVEKVWLFGSYARNEQTQFSDIDLMIRFQADNKIDLWDFVGIMQDLEDVLGTKVDLVREGGAKPFARENIEKDQMLVYERKTEGQRATGTHY